MIQKTSQNNAWFYFSCRGGLILRGRDSKVPGQMNLSNSTTPTSCMAYIKLIHLSEKKFD